MRLALCCSAALIAACLVLPSAGRALDDNKSSKSDAAAADKSTDKAADKSNEKTPPAEVTTEGTIDVGGQHIAYDAIAGTITVGATDTQDAQLGLDGKPQAGSQLALDEPKDAERSRLRWRACFTWHISRKTPRPRTGP